MINGYTISPAAKAELPPVRQTPLPTSIRGGTFGNPFAVLNDDEDDADDEPVADDQPTAHTSSPLLSADPPSGSTEGADIDDDSIIDEAEAEDPGVAKPRDEDDDHEEEYSGPPLRQSERIRLRKAYHVALQNALDAFGQAGREAAVNEIDQLLRKQVFEMLEPHVLCRHIPSQLFLKEKRDANGNIVKIKGRLVAGGHRQTRFPNEDTSSPTVSTEGLLTVVAVSAAKRHQLASVDVEGAYLECDIDREMVMKLSKDIAALLITAHPEYKAFARPDGSIHVRLKKALYGTIQASKLWFEKISGVLKENGFTANNYDKCIFTKKIGSEDIIISLHVDDTLISSTTKNGIDHCVEILSKSFHAINVTYDPTVEYLGMKISRGENGITVTMPGYADECVKAFLEHDSIGKYSTPAEPKLFDVDNSLTKLSAEKGEIFHSLAAKVQYLATKIRPDLLPAVSFLLSRKSECTSQDWTKLRRLISYISTTMNYGLCYYYDKPVELSAYIDASHGTHMEDGTSRTGIVITLAGGAICFKSSRQTIVTMSSTEAELVALTEGTNFVLWLRSLLEDLSLSQKKPTIVYQDNLSTIALVSNDKTKQQRTRHINCKYFGVRQRINDGSIKLQHLAGTDMLADILTKSVEGSTLKRLLPCMMYVANN
jgi:hypothetical protein